MSFGDRLSRLRIQCSLTQEELAERLDTSSQTIYRWEHNKSSPTVQQLRLLCTILKVKPDYFFDDSDIVDTPSTPNDSVQTENAIQVSEKTSPSILDLKKKSALQSFSAHWKILQQSFNTMLLFNRWYFWACFLPWIAFTLCLFRNVLALIVMGPPCLAFLFLSILQEVLARMRSTQLRNWQYTLSVIKCAILTGCSLTYTYLATGNSLTQFSMACITCLTLLGCSLEILRIKNTYKLPSTGETELNNSNLFLKKVYCWICLLPWLIIFLNGISVHTLEFFSIFAPLFILLTTLVQDFLTHFKQGMSKKIQYILSIGKYSVVFLGELYYIQYVRNYMLFLHIATFFSLTTALCIELYMIHKR